MKNPQAAEQLMTIRNFLQGKQKAIEAFLRETGLAVQRGELYEGKIYDAMNKFRAAFAAAQKNENPQQAQAAVSNLHNSLSLIIGSQAALVFMQEVMQLSVGQQPRAAERQAAGAGV